MTPEQGKKAGWEQFDYLPACRNGDNLCEECTEPADSGFLEMETEDWLCESYFAALAEPEADEE